MRVAPSDFTSTDYAIDGDLRSTPPFRYAYRAFYADFLRPSKLHRVDPHQLKEISDALDSLKSVVRA